MIFCSSERLRLLYHLLSVFHQCIQYVDGDNVSSLVGALVEIIKGSHGITAKGGAAHVICLLTQQCQNDIQPYAGRLSFQSCHTFPINSNCHWCIRNCRIYRVGSNFSVKTAIRRWVIVIWFVIFDEERNPLRNTFSFYVRILCNKVIWKWLEGIIIGNGKKQQELQLLSSSLRCLYNYSSIKLDSCWFD